MVDLGFSVVDAVFNLVLMVNCFVGGICFNCAIYGDIFDHRLDLVKLDLYFVEFEGNHAVIRHFEPQFGVGVVALLPFLRNIADLFLEILSGDLTNGVLTVFVQNFDFEIALRLQTVCFDNVVSVRCGKDVYFLVVVFGVEDHSSRSVVGVVKVNRPDSEEVGLVGCVERSSKAHGLIPVQMLT